MGEAGYEVAPSFEPVAHRHPYPTRSDRNAWIRRRLGAKGYLSHVGTLVGSALLRDFVAIHMTWGATNELTTLTSYHRPIAKTEHPQLVQLLNAVVKDERRHFAFYRAQARIRLARSRQARRIVRFAIDHLWAVGGTGVRPQSETDHVVTFLFGDDDGLAAVEEMQATMAELPGLEGSDFFVRARQEAAIRAMTP